MYIKKLILSFAILVLGCSPIFSQVDYNLDTSTNARLIFDKVLTLEDKNYTVEQLEKDTSLHFERKQKIAVTNMNYFWIKFTVKNNSNYDVKYSVWGYPSFENVLYVYNQDSLKWASTVGGAFLSNNKDIFDYTPCIFRGNKETTFYIKIKVKDCNTTPYKVACGIVLEKNMLSEIKSDNLKIWWLIVVCIVIAFFIYNAYLYLQFRDRLYLYYLLILFGAVIYSTTNSYFINYFFYCKLINIQILAAGNYLYIPFDDIIKQLSTIIIMIGFTQFTRSYLQTKTMLPFWDKFLKYFIIVYAGYIFIVTLFQFFNIIKSTNYYIVLFNMFHLLIIISLITVGFIAFKKRIKQAIYFLLAMAIPLAILCGFVIYLLFINSNADGLVMQRLPNIAILIQVLSFAIALAARVNIIKNDLHNKNIENQQIAGQIAISNERNSRLEEKIAYDKREVAAAQQIKLLMKELHHRVKNNLQIVSSLLSLQSFRIKDKIAADAVREGQHRIEAMSLIHQRLYTNENTTEVNIKEYVTDLAESLMQAYGYTNNNFILHLNIENELMNVDKAIPLSLIINELVTNAFKYAYANVATPTLAITLLKHQQDMQLVIADNGKGITMNDWQDKKDSYGKELVQTFTKQLNGIITITLNGGTVFHITFPAYFQPID